MTVTRLPTLVTNADFTLFTEQVKKFTLVMLLSAQQRGIKVDDFTLSRSSIKGVSKVMLMLGSISAASSGPVFLFEKRSLTQSRQAFLTSGWSRRKTVGKLTIFFIGRSVNVLLCFSIEVLR